ncbi:MAG: retropepsin-like aspartic protease [candidate division WOR-3 bacterium]
MAVIQKKIKLVGSKGSKEVLALFDSGATYSCIQPALAEQLEVITPIPEKMSFTTAKEGEILEAEFAIRVNFYLDGFRLSDEFMVISGLTEPVIIGSATLQKWRMKLDFENDEVIIDPRVTKLRLLSTTSLTSDRVLVN